jgi:hypothetical protein
MIIRPDLIRFDPAVIETMELICLPPSPELGRAGEVIETMTGKFSDLQKPLNQKLHPNQTGMEPELQRK